MLARRPERESGTKRGGYAACGCGLIRERSSGTTGGSHRQVVVEDAGTDLEQEVGCPGPLAYFFAIRLLTTWLTAASTNELEMGSSAR
jgi:hypothetical protein